MFVFFISWQGLGFFKAAPELHNDEGGPSCLPHNSSSRERAPATIMTTKGPASGGAGGVQSRAHGSMWAILCTGRLVTPFRRGVQEGAQGSEAQGGPSICQNMGRRRPEQWGRVWQRGRTSEQSVSARLTIHSGWLTPWVETFSFNTSTSSS